MDLKQSNFLQKWFLWVCLVSICIYMIFIVRTIFSINGKIYFTLVDDAMISMRYAKHFSQGFGFVWNIGEKPIQGFTNMGWTLVMSLIHLLKFPPSKISLVVMLLNVGVMVGLLYVIKEIVSICSPNNHFAQLLATICVAGNFPLIFWSLRGMEVGLITLCIGFATLSSMKIVNKFTTKYLILYGLCAFCAFVIRFDSVCQIGILSLSIGIISLKNRKISHFLYLHVGLILLIAIYIFALSKHFGSFIPNTYFLKVTGVTISEKLISGLNFFFRITLSDISFLMLASFGCLIILGFSRISLKLGILGGLFLVQCFYSIYVGGDFAEDNVGGTNRFITQGIPFLIVFFTIILSKTVEKFDFYKILSFKRQVICFFYLCAMTLFLTNGQEWLLWSRFNAPLLSFDKDRVARGLKVKNSTSKECRLATHAAGQIPYFSERYTIDLLGKNDVIVAKGKPATTFYPGHNKWDYNYSIGKLMPDIITEQWGYSDQWIEKQQSLYERLGNGMWVKRGSPYVNVQQLNTPLLK